MEITMKLKRLKTCAQVCFWLKQEVGLDFGQSKKQMIAMKLLFLTVKAKCTTFVG
jgi:hypothetical protein